MKFPKLLNLILLKNVIAIAGVGEENLKFLSRHTGVKVILRGQELLIMGLAKAVERCVKVIYFLEPYWKEGKTINLPDFHTAFQALDTGRVDDYQELQKDVLAKTRQGKVIRAKTFRQKTIY